MMASFDDFLKIDMRVGQVVDVQPFPKAKNPAYKVWVDLGDELGVKKSSAQITERYGLEDLKGRKVVAVVNFEPRQIADFMSEILILGTEDENGHIALLKPADNAPLGKKVY